MKRLAVFCDGTWNDLRMPRHTNVARLAKCVAPCDPDGVRQVVFYDSGVGVRSRVSRLMDFLGGILGGAFGRGLDEKIETAYRFLVLNYEPGDEIYVFGFSRGAYTARSLCGLIRKCGILRRDHLHLVPQALDLYRDHDLHPQKVRDFRMANAHVWSPSGGTGHAVATGREDLPEADRALWQFRYADFDRAFHLEEPEPLGGELVAGGGLESASRPAKRQDVSERIYRMVYLGLWDTVGALGVPARFPALAKIFNRRYRFHDTDASSLITAIRQAAAVDEDRSDFALTPVSNIEDLNREWARAAGRDVDTPGPGFVPYFLRPYQQRWFPGDHGAVGGGNPEPGLSSSALLWVAEGARNQGLAFNEGPGSEIDDARRHRNPLAEWRVNRDGTRKPRWKFDLLGFFGGYRERVGPLLLDEVHPTARRRWEQVRRYRPAALQRFTGETAPTPPYRLLAFFLFPPFMLLLAAGLLWVAAWIGLTLWLGHAPAFEAIGQGLRAICLWIKGLLAWRCC